MVTYNVVFVNGTSRKIAKEGLTKDQATRWLKDANAWLKRQISSSMDLREFLSLGQRAMYFEIEKSKTHVSGE